MQLIRNRWVAACLFVVCLETQAAPFVVDVPMEVEADRFELFMDEQIAVWSGNVVATQQGNTFKSAQFTLRLVPSDERDAALGATSDSNAPAGSRAFQLQAGRLSYHRDHVVGSGGCVISRGTQSIVADEISLDLRTQTLVAKPRDDGRVYVRLLLAADLPVPKSGVGGGSPSAGRAAPIAVASHDVYSAE
ncbi:MAG: LptA/OstA family protein [Pseudomonadales bacterium]